MSNLLLILAVLFASLFLLTKLLEGRAKPLAPEQAAKLSRWLMIVVAISIALAIGRELFQ
jgi:hypothetical protein